MASVTFYLPDHPNPSIFESVDPHTDWWMFKTGRDQWIPYTYVCLRQAGHDVSISNEPPPNGIAVVFAADLKRFRRECRRLKDVVILCTQADRRIPELLLADVVVQHNRVEVDGRRTFFIPNWPQPGLIPREISRGHTVRVVSYKGRLLNLADPFISEGWNDFLTERDMRFRIDTSDEESAPDISGLGAIELDETMRWNDFSDVDLVLAVRPSDPDLHPHKPALKLVNSWQAGVPALLGAELAYREMRRSDLDYIEVTSLEQAMDEIDRLRDDPELYDLMVRNGRTRGYQFSMPTVRTLWEELLFERLDGWTPNRLIHISRPYIAPLLRATRRLRRTLRQRSLTR